jgi:hypothetical protein
MTALILFYSVALSQVLLNSWVFPSKYAKRVLFLIEKYPQDLYPKPYDYNAQNGGRSHLRFYLGLNFLIALVGLAGLGVMIFSGFQLQDEGGAEAFVVLYFGVQLIPHILAAISSTNYQKRMRAENQSTRRMADLRPRRLFDFVSPWFVALAVVCFVGWVVFFLIDQGNIQIWRTNDLAGFGVILATNLVICGVIYNYIKGANKDPYQAYKDQLNSIRNVVKISVFSTIIMNVFITVSGLSDRFGWELFDPIMTSIYIQMVIIFGLDFIFRNTNIEEIGFDVYREDPTII